MCTGHIPCTTIVSLERDRQVSCPFIAFDENCDIDTYVGYRANSGHLAIHEILSFTTCSHDVSI